MFLNAVILVLQEILEAALLISLLLALGATLRQRWQGFTQMERHWVLSAMLLGFAGASLYAWFTPAVSTWFDYVGYEVVNAILQLGAVALALLFCYVLNPAALRRKPGWEARAARACMISVVAISIIREGSEIILYIQGIVGQRDKLMPVVLGTLMAAGIGFSSSFLLYHALGSLSGKWTFRIALLLLSLFAGNMACQAALLLTQADWLPYTPQLWDSSGILPEYTIAGQLLYALVGYEANPSLLQALAYFATATLVVLSPLFRSAWSREA